jgi:hypothetical protein
MLIEFSPVRLNLDFIGQASTNMRGFAPVDFDQSTGANRLFAAAGQIIIQI